MTIEEAKAEILGIWDGPKAHFYHRRCDWSNVPRYETYARADESCDNSVCIGASHPEVSLRMAVAAVKASK